MREEILIIYNLPKEGGCCGQDFCKESDAGVLAEVEAVTDALKKLNVDYRSTGIRRLSDLSAILQDSPERIIFNLVEELDGGGFEAALVPAVCNSYGKECTGNDTISQFLSLDKLRTKALLIQAKLPCPPGIIVSVGGTVREADLPQGPYIVKPLCTDASEGIDSGSVVDKAGRDLQNCVEKIHKHFNQPAIIEGYVGNRELNISLLQINGSVEVLPIAEIDFSTFRKDKPRIVDYAAKWLPESFEYKNTPRIIPASLPDDIADAAREYSLAAWRALGCRDYVRVDFRLDENGSLFILEVNTNPDISPDAGFAAALGAAGVSYENFVAGLLDNASARLGNISGSNCGSSSSPKKTGTVNIRRACAADRDNVLTFMTETGFFRLDEMDIAAEVFDDAIKGGEKGHYQSFVADEDGRVIGWVCFGPTPCTLGTFDIYWIAVAPKIQSAGVGTALMQFAEKEIKARDGRLVVVETSGRAIYHPTRQFYIRKGYREVTRVRNFYAPGDDKVIFTKRLA